MKNRLWFLPLTCLVIAACEPKSDDNDKVKDIDKDGSVEMKVEINHLDSLLDVMRTEKVFWVKGQAVKTVVDLDTVPALGFKKETTQDTAGNDTTVTINKNYQIFITVR